MESAELAARLGARLQAVRRRCGLTQERVAELSGLAANYISEVERGAKSPSLDAVARIAEALDTSLAECFFGVDRSPPKELVSLEQVFAGLSPSVQTSLLRVLEASLGLIETGD